MSDHDRSEKTVGGEVRPLRGSLSGDLLSRAYVGVRGRGRDQAGAATAEDARAQIPLMSDERWIVIPDWEKFQHYKDRNPTWIKVYTDLLQDDDYLALAPTSRALLHGIWALYALTNGRLRTGRAQVALKMRAKREHWEELVYAGFIELSASRPVPIRYPRDREREREEEPASKEEQKLPPSDPEAATKARKMVEHLSRQLGSDEEVEW
jgi:hypothetical protein